MSNHSLQLTPAERRRWRQDGYFVRTGQFSPRELANLRDAADRAAELALARSCQGRGYQLDGKRFVDIGHATIQFEHVPGPERIRVLEPAHLFDSRLDAVIDDPRLTIPMLGLVGGQALALWTSKLNVKGGNGSAFPWHQDSPYWMHDCGHVDRLPNVMLALDAQHRDNGCFRIIAGSHDTGILPGTNDGSQLGGFYTHPDSFDTSRQALMEVAAGALIFFSPHSVHGSMPNRSNGPRRALIFTYQPANHPMLKNGEVRPVAI